MKSHLHFIFVHHKCTCNPERESSFHLDFGRITNVYIQEPRKPITNTWLVYLKHPHTTDQKRKLQWTWVLYSRGWTWMMLWWTRSKDACLNKLQARCQSWSVGYKCHLFVLRAPGTHTSHEPKKQFTASQKQSISSQVYTQTSMWLHTHSVYQAVKGLTVRYVSCPYFDIHYPYIHVM